MKIAQAQIQMHSNHVYQREQSKEESLKTWVGNERPRVEEEQTTSREHTRHGGDRLSLSQTAMRHYLQKSAIKDTQPQAASQIDSNEDPQLTAMRLIIEALTGKKIYTPSLHEYQNDSGSVTELSPNTPNQEAPAKAGWGMEYSYHEMHAEHEEMTFTAQGQVQTTDGLSINLKLAMDMSRDFVETIDIQLRAGDAVLVDPLVINFADKLPGLTQQKFAFDLNSDGANEQISFVTPGSGFLFLDRNNDGKATDGSELFGPKSGSGFTELADLDSDANGWLDDNDPLFAKLQIWIKDAVGSDYFASLRDVNIGAILLSPAATPFSINNQQNTQLGQITNSSLFLREDGRAGSIQEIKLAV